MLQLLSLKKMINSKQHVYAERSRSMTIKKQ